MNTPTNTRPVSIQPGRCLLLGLALLTVNALLPTEAAAQTNVPLLVNYQGTVTDSTGLPLGATGTVSAPVAAPVNRKIIFRFWDAATGGTRLWTEEQTVTISLGQFSVLLGQGINATGTAAGESRPALDTVFTGTGNDRFLGVTVDNGDNNITGADTEITPRQRITSVAYSLRARAADSVASTTDLMLGGSANYGLGWYGTGRLFNAVNVNGPVLYGQGGGILGAVNGATQTPVLRWNELGQVGIGTTAMPSGSELTLQGDDTNTPPLHLNIRGNTETNKRLLIGYNTTGNYGAIQAYNGTSGTPNTTTALLLNQAGGNVGIGNASPTSRLDVTGGIKATGAGGYSFNTGDLDGGLFSPADGMLTFNTNGTEKLRVDGSGNVGINTTTPLSTLHVNGIISARPSNVNHGYIALQTGSATDDGYIEWYKPNGSRSAYMGYSGLNNLQLTLAGTHNFLITGNGNVGIGTATPGERLTIVGSGSTSTSTALSVWNSAISPLFHVRNDGNVGVGTNTPGSRLDVNGKAAASVLQARGIVGTHDQGAYIEWNRWGEGETDINNQKGLGSGGFTFNEVDAANNYTERMKINPAGNVGIGTNNPVQGRLVVSGAGSTNNFGSTWIYGSGGAAANGPINETNSIYAFASISGSHFRAFSDRRIKQIVGRSDSSHDLATVLGIEITDYRYIDKLAYGNKTHKKVIAQQLEQVFPQAVKHTTDVVPDIYRRASIKDGWITLTTGLKKGERVRLISPKADGVYEVLEVKKDGFRTAFKPQGDDVFVFGREVNDFRSVDYEAISMLNVSATQQIKKEKDAEVKALKDENADLKARVETLEAQTERLADLEAKDKAREAKLAAIEKLLLALEKGVAQPVSLKKSASGAE